MGSIQYSNCHPTLLQNRRGHRKRTWTPRSCAMYFLDFWPRHYLHTPHANSQPWICREQQGSASGKALHTHTHTHTRTHTSISVTKGMYCILFEMRALYSVCRSALGPEHTHTCNRSPYLCHPMGFIPQTLLLVDKIQTRM